MKNTDMIKRNIMQVIKNTLEAEASTIVKQVELDYRQLDSDLGNAEARYELTELTKEILLLTLFGKGQRALIGEFGRGSLLDRDNPALQDYINGDIFNSDRLKHNFKIVTRINDDAYRDLDDRTIKRPAPKHLVNLENKKPRYKPVKPRYILQKAIEQRIDKIALALAEAVAIETAFENLFRGMTVKASV